MRPVYRTIDVWIGRIEGLLITPGLTLAFLLGMYQVVFRYAFGEGRDWVEGVIVMLVSWAAFAGASRAVKDGIHVRLDVLLDYLPIPARRGVEILSLLIALAYAVCLFVLSVQYNDFVVGTGEILISTRLPAWVSGLALSVGLLLMILRSSTAVAARLPGPGDD